jgi:hypothetical protein
MDGFQFLSPPDRIPNSGDPLGENQVLPGVEPQGMTDEDFEGAFRAAADDAVDYADAFIGPMRAAATQYYRGDLFGNEEAGRSQVVMTEVRDSVLGVLPSLLRTFVGGDHPVEFVPQNAESVEIAKQQTDYVSHVLMQDNPGFILLHSMIKDALTRKTGILKWRWSEDVTITETAFTGLLAEQVQLLQQDPTTELYELIGQPSTEAVSGQPPPPTFDCRIRRRIPARRCVIEALAPEEWLINRDARDANDERGYTFQAHRSIKTISEIIAMGYSREEIEEHAGGGDGFTSNLEQVARNPAMSGLMGATNTPDESMHRVLFIEAYIRADRDGDGIAELHRVHAIGGNYHILSDEIVDEAPFAVFCPDPEPHTVIGNSVADQVMDLQRIKSNMMRGTLDSAAGSLFPRTAVVEGQVNLDDVLNTESGSVIRMRQAGAVQELTKPFIGPSMLPLLAYVDQIKSKRTGLTDAAQGLSPELLQSSTQDAVSATITGAQERIEMYARIMAETAMRRLFRGVAKLLRENQDAPRMVKLRGQFVAVDPRSWVGELQCVPNVAMGRGTDAQRMGFLGQIAAKQEQIIGLLGPVNPIAGVDRLVATYTEMTTLAGFKDASKYFGTAPPEIMQQMQQAAANKPPQPAEILAQAEMIKVQSDAQFKAAKLQQEQYEAALTHERETLKIILDAMAKLEQTDAQYGLNPSDQALIDSLLQHRTREAEVQANFMAAIHRNQMQAGAQVQSAQARVPQPQPQLPGLLQ